MASISKTEQLNSMRRGEAASLQSNFIGIAFRVVDNENYDCVYFRPFNFRSADPERRSHSVQYMSVPDWPWSRLRREKTGQYEQPIESAPDGDSWFHEKVVFENHILRVYVNGAGIPSLQVKELTERRGGGVGLWFDVYGMIANVSINKAR